jgi:hypothetical protein
MSESSRRESAPPREAELAEAEERARGAGKAAEALSRSASDVGRLAAEVRRQRRENESLRAENAELADRLRKAERAPTGGTPSEGRKPVPPSRDEPVEAELGSLMSAPFRVSPQAASAAKSDPLAALAVQVARALSDDARDLERARLIAMAFAASRGDLDAFWSARRQRGGKKAASAK